MLGSAERCAPLPDQAEMDAWAKIIAGLPGVRSVAEFLGPRTTTVLEGATPARLQCIREEKTLLAESEVDPALAALQEAKLSAEARNSVLAEFSTDAHTSGSLAINAT